MKKIHLPLTDGFSFIETAAALCLVSVTAVLVSAFSGSFFAASARLKEECADETLFLETAESFIDAVSGLEVFPYGNNVSLSFSERSLHLFSKAKKELLAFSFPERLAIKNARLLFYRGFVSGIEVQIMNKGERYKIKSDFSDLFPGKKELP